MRYSRQLSKWSAIATLCVTGLFISASSAQASAGTYHCSSVSKTSEDGYWYYSAKGCTGDGGSEVGWLFVGEDSYFCRDGFSSLSGMGELKAYTCEERDRSPHPLS